MRRTYVSQVDYCTTLSPPGGFPLTLVVHGKPSLHTTDTVEHVFVFHDPDSLSKIGNALQGAWNDINQ